MSGKQRSEVDGVSKVALDKYEAEHGELQGDVVTESGPHLVIVTPSCCASRACSSSSRRC
jgi:hypothetical protein